MISADDFAKKYDLDKRTMSATQIFMLAICQKVNTEGFLNLSELYPKKLAMQSSEKLMFFLTLESLEGELKESKEVIESERPDDAAAIIDALTSLARGATRKAMRRALLDAGIEPVEAFKRLDEMEEAK